MEKLLNFVGYARKFCVAAAAALAVLGTALADGAVTTNEWVSVGLTFLSAIGVYYVTNNTGEKK